ncbi:MAG: response regulator [Candidatus Marinimicrobia bacterium]|nr:response regulator [Candidatus Neomarinimicrobiota bacterium]
MNSQNQLKIMVIDDNPEILDCFKSIFDKSGAHLFLSKNPVTAIEEFKRTPYNIAFIDLYMPVINGLETMERLKEINPDLVAIIISGFRNPKMPEIAKKSGAQDYLFKPLDIKDILLGTIVSKKQQ